MSDQDNLEYEPDVVSDPEEGVGEGQDWTDEGGAMSGGPAEGEDV